MTCKSSLWFVLLAGLWTLLLCFAATAASVKVEQNETPMISDLDFRRASLDEALKFLFTLTPYNYVLAPEVSPESKITLALKNVPFDSALRAILEQANLTFNKKDNTYYIMRVGAQIPKPAPPDKTQPAEKKPRLLYLTDYGALTQLRLRTFPYPGDEKILWQGPGAGKTLYFLPSPSFTHAAVVARGWQSEGGGVFLVNLESGAAEEIGGGLHIEYIIWKTADILSLLAVASEYNYEIKNKQLRLIKTTPIDQSGGTDQQTLAFLEPPFAKSINLLKAQSKNRSLSLPVEKDDIEGAILRGAGIPYIEPATIGLPVPYAVASIFPDNDWLAYTTGRDAVFIIHLGEYGSSISTVIPLTALVQGEGVSVDDLRWSADSKYVIFTEVHSHPSQFHAPDLPPGPDPLDWTNLIRLHDLKEDKTVTIALGRNGFLLPDK